MPNCRNHHAICRLFWPACAPRRLSVCDKHGIIIFMKMNNRRTRRFLKKYRVSASVASIAIAVGFVAYGMNGSLVSYRSLLPQVAESMLGTDKEAAKAEKEAAKAKAQQEKEDQKAEKQAAKEAEKAAKQASQEAAKAEKAAAKDAAKAAKDEEKKGGGAVAADDAAAESPADAPAAPDAAPEAPAPAVSAPPAADQSSSGRAYNAEAAIIAAQKLYQSAASFDAKKEMLSLSIRVAGGDFFWKQHRFTLQSSAGCTDDYASYPVPSFTNETGSIPAGSSYAWSFPVAVSSLKPEAATCFRIVKEGGGLLNGYEVLGRVQGPAAH